MTTPIHLERQFMEGLQGAGLVKAITLPSSPRVIDRLLSKGWIESCNIDNRLCYRITEQSLALQMAKKGRRQACSVKMQAPSLHEATTFSDKTGG